ncbi:MAG: sigma-54-dependent Fis family transcriptional regulator [Clostridia bacterium]|nr:sigma-54-dependent Fis family transcriptional regulator [Clostridia bacterium]
MTTPPALPIRVLAIAPYDAMAASLSRTAEAFPGILLEAYTGDLQEGVDIMRQMGTENYDAIISRGGTADLLRAATELPVIEIPVSVYDVLRTIKLAESYTDRSAIVGFPSVTENAHTLCNLLRLEIPILTVHDSSSVNAALKKLRAQGISTVICDMVTHRTARTEGFNALLIASGENSLQQALQEAEHQGSSFRRMRSENLFLRSILRRDSRQCIVFNEEKEPVFSFSENFPQDLMAVMRRRIPSISENNEIMFYHRDRSTLHAITASAFRVQGQKYFLFRDQSGQIPLRSTHPGIRAYDLDECEYLFASSFFSLTGSMGELEQRLTPLAASEHAVMIIGEVGTGKEQIARALYLRSRFKNHPFIMVDGARLNDRGWDYLLEHHASPLSTTGTAICFQHLEEAPLHRQRSLFSLIEETGLDRRLWLIFSCDEQEGIPLSEFSQNLSARLGPLTLHLPPLRSRKDEIPALSSVYLGNLNVELGKQLSGFEPGALDMLIRYDWPGNYTQFKHVLQELSFLTVGPYISATDVADLLARERRVFHRPSDAVASLPFAGQTLEEITRSAVQMALAANGGNQTLAARQLGISRTTLWRMLSQT